MRAPPDPTVGYLKGAVFLSGGTILVVEIAASRILAPYFGNTLFTWTSLIGVILGALSAGYAVGGRLADRSPSGSLFARLMLVGAALVALVPSLRVAVLRLLGENLGIRSGPVLGGVILFAAPSFVLAMLTPFAVKLSARLESELGRTTGSLFAYSTVGSIAGTFLSGFVLIPHFGLNSIFLATAAALTATAALGLATAFRNETRSRRWDIGAILVATASLLLGTLLAATPRRPGTTSLWYQENSYHAIEVVEYQREGKPIRELYLDSQTEGAMVVGGDAALPDAYMRFLHLWSWAVPGLASALFVGGGAFSMPKALRAMQPDAEIEVIELDPDVISVARRFFRIDAYPRLSIRNGDARRALRELDRRFDLIFLDAFRGRRNVPPHLATREFFGEVRSHIEPGGLMMLNLLSAREGPGSELASAMLRTVRAVFPEVWVFSTHPRAPRGLQNLIFFGFRDPDDARATRLAENPSLASAQRFRVSLPAPGPSVEVLTDDYNPVEFLVELGLAAYVASDPVARAP